MSHSEPAGKFPYTVDLYQPTAGSADGYGHKTTSYAVVAQAAARVWTVSNASTQSDPADLVTRTPRLLLKEPIQGIEVGWRVMWKGKLFQIDATEERGWDLLITLNPVARTA